jgi:hypothetical protein
MKPKGEVWRTRAVRLQGIHFVLAAFLALGAVYAIATPLFEASDELWHYPMVKTLADGNGLPVQDAANLGPWRQEGSQPPLYYAVMALATRWIDTSDMAVLRWINPHADNGVITADGNNNMVIHTSREAWPWQGTVLAVRLARLLSVLLGAGTLYFTYRLGLEIAPGERGLALAAAAFAGATPMFLFITASVNNDNLAICLSSAALWLLARWLRRPPSAAGWSHVILGLILGGGALSKQSALGLFPLSGLVILAAQFQRYRLAPRAQRGRRRLAASALQVLAQSAIVLGLAAVVAFWWYLRNWQLYGGWLGWNVFVKIVSARAQPAGLAQLWGERAGFAQAYWGLFGGVSVPLPSWAYPVLNLIVAASLLGLAWGFLRAWCARRIGFTDAALWILPAIWLALLMVGLYRWTSVTQASQGRLVFPGIAAISWFVVAGLRRFWRGLPWASVALLAGLAAATPFAIILPHYAPPPPLTAAQQAAIPNRLDADFGGEMKLLGYRLDTPSALPGDSLRLTLYWQSETAMDRNWSIFLHVVDDAGVIIAQRDRYPGQGALATSLLRPGQTFADEYVVQLPAGTYSPASAVIEVGLYDLLDGARLPLAGGGDSLRLAPVQVLVRPGDVPNALRQDIGGKLELAGYALGARVLHPGETLDLTLYWQALSKMRVNYSVSARVRGEGETLWARQDGWPRQGAAPTSTWALGQMLTDDYALALDPQTPPGQYDVEVVVYDSATLRRLQMVTPDGRLVDADSVRLGQIRVVEP